MATWAARPLIRENQLAVNGELTVVERLTTLLDTGQFSDVNVRVGKGSTAKVFKAHRLLLASASQPLYKLVYAVQPNPGACEITTVRVSDIEPKAFETVLKYIYTDKVNVNTINDAFLVLKASKKWGLKDMEEKTLTFIKTYLDDYEPDSEERKNDICELLVYLGNETEQLSEKCWQVIATNANEIIPCQGFLNLEEGLIRKLLNRPDFKYDKPLMLFEAIRDWGMNQILLRNLSPRQLQPIVAELISHINFESINDADFINTCLPSDCLSKGDMIAFFMSRGMEIPRDMSCNNNSQLPSLNNVGDMLELNKVCRFRRGYQLPTEEIYQEHELRFRINKHVRLLGVVFGFLFSNTDMGVTVHCQGPWERVQWTDMIRTYCRVSWEKMQTADVRLMFTEPVKIEAHHSYKILVRVGRMSSGTSEVEMWGGDQGAGTIKSNGAEFYFIKAAIDPQKEVEESETENKRGMITELLYQLSNETEITESEPKKVLERPKPKEEEPSPVEKPAIRRRERVPSYVSTVTPTYDRKRPSAVALDDSKPFESSTPVRRHWQSSLSTTSQTSSEPLKSPEIYTTQRHRMSQDKLPETSLSFGRRPSAEKEVSPYFLRSRNPSISSSSSYTKPQYNREDSKPNDSSYSGSSYGRSRYSREESKPEENNYSGSTYTRSRYSREEPKQEENKYGVSTNTRTRYSREESKPEPNPTSAISYTRSRYSRDEPKSDPNSSIHSSILSNDTRQSRDSSRRPSQIGVGSTPLSLHEKASSITKRESSRTRAQEREPTSSVYRRDSSVSRYGRDSSVTRYGRDSSSSRVRRDSAVSRPNDYTPSLSKNEPLSSTSRFGGTSSTTLTGKSFTSTPTKYSTRTDPASTEVKSNLGYTSTRNTSDSVPTCLRKGSTSTTSSSNLLGRDSLSSRYPSSVGYGSRLSTSGGSSVGSYASSTSRYGSSYSRR